MRRFAMGVAIVGVAALLLSGMVALAGGPGGGRGGGGRGPAMTVDEMKTLLNLTDDQVTKIKEAQATRDAARTAATDGAGRMAAMQAYNTALQGILTPEQQTKLQAAIAARMPGGGGAGVAGKLQRLETELQGMGLTGDAATKVTAARTARDAEIDKAINAFVDAIKSSLTPEQQARVTAALTAPAGGGVRGGRNRRGAGGAPGATPAPTPAPAPAG